MHRNYVLLSCGTWKNAHMPDEGARTKAHTVTEFLEEAREHYAQAPPQPQDRAGLSVPDAPVRSPDPHAEPGSGFWHVFWFGRGTDSATPLGSGSGRSSPGPGVVRATSGLPPVILSGSEESPRRSAGRLPRGRSRSNRFKRRATNQVIRKCEKRFSPRHRDTFGSKKNTIGSS